VNTPLSRRDKRLLAAAAGVAGALALAVLPIAVITARSDTMDSVMGALVLGAAALIARAASHPDGRRGRLLLVAGATAFAGLAPFYLGSGAAHARGSLNGLRITPSYFHPEQLFWPLRAKVLAPGSAIPGYRGPEILAHVAHPLIVALALPLSGLFAWRLRRAAVQRRDALALLALLLLLRCVLDPWDSIYYLVPAVLALVAWEALVREGLPSGAIALVALGHLTFVTLEPRITPDALAACYLAWALPATALLARAAFAGVRAADPRPQAMSSAIAARTSPGAT